LEILGTYVGVTWRRRVI